MKVTSTLNIGGASFTFEVEDAEEMAAMVNSITLASPRRTCNVCGADGLETKQLLAYRTKEGYRYVKVQCECGARSSLGQYRDGDGFFWKEYEEYVRDGEDAPQQPATASQNAPSQQNDNRITPDGIKAIQQVLDVLEWSQKEVDGIVQQRYGADFIQQLTVEQGRDLWKYLESEKKRLVPF